MDRNPALDGLRGVSVIAVLMFHCGVLPGGSVGVDVFFVLSGYLITSILARELAARGTIDIPAFLLRRARRLIPALAFLLLVYALIFNGHPDTLLRVALAASYTMNIAEAFATGAGGPLSHTWSLAIEEQFYLIWPLILLGLLRLGRQRAVMMLLAAWLAFTLARTSWLLLGANPPGVAYYLLHPTGLLLGSALALRKPGLRAGWMGLVALAAIFLVDSRAHVLPAITLGELAAGMVILEPPSFLGAAPLRALGRVSYAVYLWHIPVLWILGSPTGWAAAALVAALSIGIAAASWRYIEEPILRRSWRELRPPAADTTGLG